jgi:hypothetical protein
VTECVVCRGFAFLRCPKCQKPLCDNVCAGIHKVDHKNIPPVRYETGHLRREAHWGKMR